MDIKFETIYYKNGNNYEGEWKKIGNEMFYYYIGVKDGEPFEYIKNKKGKKREVFYWKDNDAVIDSSKNGDIYEGYTKNGIKCGKGIMYYKNGDKYEGHFDEGIRKGKGKIIYINGDIFKGKFEYDKKYGFGTFTYVNGDTLKGYFIGNWCEKGQFKDKKNGEIKNCRLIRKTIYDL